MSWHRSILHSRIGASTDPGAVHDGGWGALDGRLLYHHAKTAGYLYEAHLRHDLTRRLGVAWGPVKNGIADLDGIPKRILKAFSRRRDEIVERMDARGEHSPRAAQVAVLATRDAKHHHVPIEDLLEDWTGRAIDLGLDPVSIPALLGRARPDVIDLGRARQLTARLLGAEGLTAHASTFDRRAALRALCELLPTGAPSNQVEALADRVLGHDQVVTLDGEHGARAVIRRSDGRRVPIADPASTYSTSELLAIEERLLAVSERTLGAGMAVASPGAVTAALECRPELADEQAALVKRLTTSGNGVDVVIAAAGTGKTFSLDAARDTWSRSGYHVIGATLAAKAARELETSAGIPSDTIARLLAELERPDGYRLDRATVLVVDEAGMVGTRTLARLVAHAGCAGTKVVLVGDDRQLPEIDAGGALAGLATRLEPLRLGVNRRQHGAWERQALAAWRDGHISRALDTYERHGRIVTAATAPDVRHAIVADWWDATRTDATTVMVAARRADVDDLNGRARAVLNELGIVNGPTLLVDERPYQAGDRVMTLRNDRRLGVRNGETATVTTVDAERRQLVLRTDHDTTVTLPASYLEAGHLTHAYATTIHKAQGVTREHALVLGTDDLDRENGYVAMSRGAVTNTLYIVDPEPDAEHHGPEPEPQDPLDRLAWHLEASRAQRLALDTLDPDSLTRSLAMRHAERAHLDQHGGARARVDSTDRVIARLLDGLVQARTLHPLAYLTRELGPPPADQRTRGHWQHGVRIIESYRTAHDITDPTHALGPEPRGRAERLAWHDVAAELNSYERVLRAMNSIQQALHRSQTHGVDTPSVGPSPVPRGPELGIDL